MHVKENSTYRQINICRFLVILLCHQSFPVWRQKCLFKIPQNSLRNFRAKSRASTYPWVPHNEDRSVRCTATSAHPAIDENCGDPAPIPWRGLWQGSSAWKINPTSFLPLIIFWQKNCHITVAFIHSYERQGITRCRSPVQMESHHEHASHAAGAEPRGPPSPVFSRPIHSEANSTHGEWYQRAARRGQSLHIPAAFRSAALQSAMRILCSTQYGEFVFCTDFALFECRNLRALAVQRWWIYSEEY